MRGFRIRPQLELLVVMSDDMSLTSGPKFLPLHTNYQSTSNSHTTIQRHIHRHQSTLMHYVPYKAQMQYVSHPFSHPEFDLHHLPCILWLYSNVPNLHQWTVMFQSLPEMAHHHPWEKKVNSYFQRSEVHQPRCKSQVLIKERKRKKIFTTQVTTMISFLVVSSSLILWTAPQTCEQPSWTTEGPS